VALFGPGSAGAGGFFDTSVPRTLPPESPAFTGFQDQLAAADLALLNPQPQVASLPPPAAAPSLLRRQPPPRNLLFEPPGMGASDREEEARAEQKRRDEYRADLLANRLDKATLWSGLKGAQFAQKALPFASPLGYLADRFVPESGVKSFFLGFNPFEQARLDEAAHRTALMENQLSTQSYGPGAVSDAIVVDNRFRGLSPTETAFSEVAAAGMFDDVDRYIDAFVNDPNNRVDTTDSDYGGFQSDVGGGFETDTTGPDYGGFQGGVGGGFEEFR